MDNQDIESLILQLPLDKGHHDDSVPSYLIDSSTNALYVLPMVTPTGKTYSFKSLLKEEEGEEEKEKEIKLDECKNDNDKQRSIDKFINDRLELLVEKVTNNPTDEIIEYLVKILPLLDEERLCCKSPKQKLQSIIDQPEFQSKWSHLLNSYQDPSSPSSLSNLYLNSQPSSQQQVQPLNNEELNDNKDDDNDNNNEDINNNNKRKDEDDNNNNLKKEKKEFIFKEEEKEILFKLELDGRFIIVKHGDIVKQNVDVIVNPANSMLAHGGGAARAIAMAAGRKYEDDGDKYVRTVGRIETGDAMLMPSGYKITQIKAIINAVGPSVSGKLTQKHRDLLSSAVLRSLTLTNEGGYTSIALPAISAGIFGFPKRDCAQIIVNTTTQFLIDNPQSSIQYILFIDFNWDVLDCLQDQLIAKKQQSKFNK